MDFKRALLAVGLSLLIIIGYQFFAAKFLPAPPPPQETPQTQEQTAATQPAPQTPANTAATPATKVDIPKVAVDPKARTLNIDTPYYGTKFTEQGGGMDSFMLKKYRSELDAHSKPLQLIHSENPADFPVLFSLDNAAGGALPLYHGDKLDLSLTDPTATGSLQMQAITKEGLNIQETLSFRADSYLIDVTYKVTNPSDKPVQVSPALSLANRPFSHSSQTSSYLFSGPAAYVNGELVETKAKELTKGPVVLQGKVAWTGYVDNYFMTAVVPTTPAAHTVTLQGSEEHVRSVISEGIVSIPAGTSKDFTYTLYFGPKKLTILQQDGHELAKAVNFGWFDVLAKPMLWLLNTFYKFIGNYGVAIILLTVLIKLIFWPITQKGMKSMKNMQKLQPKIAKIREKYKSDPTMMNQEMMNLYKTYKVNPMGGCLPMLIQIPFFFALYRVLMAAIELRHAPFMLWINDLSAPDRLFIGFDIPYLHGIPVLTLLMGASMYLQQKMTPTTADPNQARIMQFLPIVFTFMFLNFASGLVLYWFVNNLLSMLQQYLINRQLKN